MKERPNLIVTMVFFLLFAPFIKISIESLSDHIYIMDIFASRLCLDAKCWIYFFALPAIGAVLFNMKLGSLFLVLPSSLLMIVYNIRLLNGALAIVDDATVFESSFDLVLLVSTLLIIIFPGYIKLFFRPHLRWWENHKRYKINRECLVDNSLKGRFIDISLGGAYVVVDEEFYKDQVELGFKTEERALLVEVKVVYRDVHPDGKYGYGVRFIKTEKTQKKSIKKFISYCKKRSSQLI